MSHRSAIQCGLVLGGVCSLMVGIFMLAFSEMLHGVETPRQLGQQSKVGDERPSFVPLTWDEKELATMEMPLANPNASPKHISASYYYSIPVRPIYQSYPIFDPRSGKEPKTYLDDLKNKKPVILWDETKGIKPRLVTEADWIEAGKAVFEAPIAYEDDRLSAIIISPLVRDPNWYKQIGLPPAADGTMPFARYIVTDKGLCVGNLGCAMCHTRILPGGMVIKGAQGNIPFDRMIAFLIRGAPNNAEALAGLRGALSLLFETPWLKPDPLNALKKLSFEQLDAARQAIPAGVVARHGTSLWYPVQVPDLIGLENRKFFDRTGLVKHRGVGDLMRYAALNQGADLLKSFSGFIPGGVDSRKLPDPRTVPFQGRYSDTQLFALAKYLYSLQPPENPNRPKIKDQEELVKRGEAIFHSEGCALCHSPKKGLYTNNKLTPAEGFQIPDEHRKNLRDWVMTTSVGTDPNLACQTGRGTGYYKAPSLKGVWYRGPFEHYGTIATLEDWLDARRLEDNYKPGGFSNRGGKPGPVRGHEFGLGLAQDETRAPIAFLKCL